MNAEPAPKLPYNGAMLRWAREWRGRSIEESAEKIGVDPERLRAWESGIKDDVPTVRQARILAEFYGRAFMEFFYDAEPQIQESGLIPDYRVHKDAPDPRSIREILEIQHWAEIQRINALELYSDIGELVPELPAGLQASLEEDVEPFAERAREALSFSFTIQRAMKYRERQELPELLRSRIEEIGVLVLRQNELAKYGVSGMTIVQFPLPIIVFAKEPPGRSAFTIMHEFAHIVLRESAISGSGRAQNGASQGRRVERWCDKFAAAFLAPKAAIEDLRGPQPETPAVSIADEILSAIANQFKISQHAMLIRLVDLGYVDNSYYWSVKRPQFMAEEALWKSRGFARVWASRIWNQMGHVYTGLVVEALGTGKIGPYQAQTFLGIHNPVHLTAIRQEFGAG